MPEAVKGLAKAKRQGVARHIGIANFNTTLIEQALKSCPEPIVALQAEYRPYLDQTKVLAACDKHGLAFVAYCPLGRGRLFDDPVLNEIARNRGRTVAQNYWTRRSRSSPSRYVALQRISSLISTNIYDLDGMALPSSPAPLAAVCSTTVSGNSSGPPRAVRTVALAGSMQQVRKVPATSNTGRITAILDVFDRASTTTR